MLRATSLNHTRVTHIPKTLFMGAIMGKPLTSQATHIHSAWQMVPGTSEMVTIGEFVEDFASGDTLKRTGLVGLLNFNDYINVRDFMFEGKQFNLVPYLDTLYAEKHGLVDYVLG